MSNLSNCLVGGYLEVKWWSLLAPSQVGENNTCEASYYRGCDLVFAGLASAQLKVLFFKKESYCGLGIETEGTAPEGS